MKSKKLFWRRYVGGEYDVQRVVHESDPNVVILHEIVAISIEGSTSPCSEI